jgi:hypothetical protein
MTVVDDDAADDQTAGSAKARPRADDADPEGDLVTGKAFARETVTEREHGAR